MAEAARLSGMLAPARLGGGLNRFLADRTFAVLTGRDRDGRLWISPLAGRPGFLAPASATTLTIHAAPAPGDPLHALPAEQPVGLLVIDFAGRRRVRINGNLTGADSGTLHVEAAQASATARGTSSGATSNRPRRGEPVTGEKDSAVRRGTGLTAADTALIGAADTFFIGTAHATGGADASHRGGSPGFVRVDDGHLWWPDYAGNNMFNTLGNLAADPAAALLFAGFGTGQTLHLSGTAALDWTIPSIPGDDDGTGRRVRFTPEAVVAGRLLPVRAGRPPLTSTTHRSPATPTAPLARQARKDAIVTEQRPPFPPFNLDSAITKVQAAEDAWNTRDPHRVSLAYTEDSVWRNRDQFITGRAEIVKFLTAKWERELDYVLRKSLWGFRENRIAVRFQYECHDRDGQWFRSYGNELWEFDDNGLMRRREASIDDVPISEADRRYSGPRPENERGTGHEILLR